MLKLEKISTVNLQFKAPELCKELMHVIKYMISHGAK